MTSTPEIRDFAELFLSEPIVSVTHEPIDLMGGQILFNLLGNYHNTMNKWAQVLSEKYSVPNPNRLLESDPERIYQLPDHIADINEYTSRNWKYYKPSHHTLNSLKYLWSVLDPEGFDSYLINDSNDVNNDKVKTMERLVIEAKRITLNHKIVAEYIYYSNCFKFVSFTRGGKDKTLLYYNDYVWEELGTKSILLIVFKIVDIIGDEIYSMERELRVLHETNVRQCNRDAISKLEIAIKGMRRAQDKLSARPFVDNVYKNVADLVLDPNFNKKVDSHANLTFTKNNRVILCHGGKVFTRMPFPEDYITRRVGFSVGNDMCLTHKDEFDTWLDQLFPGQDLKIYIFKYLASFLLSGNDDKLFHVLSGSGDNSKTTFIKCIAKALGDYAGAVSSVILSGGNKQSSQADPSIRHMVQLRLAYFEEPALGCTMEGERVKEITGGGNMYVRDIYEKGREMFIESKILLSVNRFPNINNNDNAVKRRTRIIPFISQWVPASQLPKSKRRQNEERLFLKDETFMSNTDKFTDVIGMYMIKYFPLWFEEKLNDPPVEINKENESYWDSNDIYVKYKNERLILHLNKRSPSAKQNKVSKQAMYSDFVSFVLKLKGSGYNKIDPPEFTNFVYHINQVLHSKSQTSNPNFCCVELRPLTEEGAPIGVIVQKEDKKKKDAKKDLYYSSDEDVQDDET